MNIEDIEVGMEVWGFIWGVPTKGYVTGFGYAEDRDKVFVEWAYSEEDVLCNPQDLSHDIEI